MAPATQPDDQQATAVRVLATGRVRAGGGPGCLQGEPLQVVSVSPAR